MELTLTALIVNILLVIIAFLIAGQVVSWAWNNAIVPIFKREPITQTQGLALFVFVFMLLGFWRV